MPDQATRQMTREEVPVELTWNLADIYPSATAWESDLHAVDDALPALVAYRGRLGDGAPTLLSFLQARDALAERYLKVLTYAVFSASVDGMAPDAQALEARAMELYVRVTSALAFVSSELLLLPEGTVEADLEAEPGLGVFRKQLEDVLRRRGHTLGQETEGALAALAEVLLLPRTIWERVTAVDLACPPIDDGNGGEAAVSISRWFFGYSQSPDRELRRRAYESLAKGLDAHKHTLASALATEIKRNVTLARIRGYNSAVEMFLAAERLPEEVYRTILDEVHDGMAPHVRRLVQLRRRILGLDEVHHYDLLASVEPASSASTDPAFTYDDCERVVRESLACLGDEYGRMLEAAFHERWIDRADNVGKSTGGFCSSAYGVHPYVLVTWQDDPRGALILAHELGHAAHFFLSSKSQIVSNVPAMLSNLTGVEPELFFSEGPSTANEILVGQHLLDTTDDPSLRRAVLKQLLATFTHNMVTHMLEAHFEQRLYDLAEAGQPLTTTTIMEVQAGVFARFYGDAVVPDEGAKLYWAQQPHFYMGLYPYAYSAGLAIGLSIAEQIREEGQPAVDRWLETLRAGETLAPLELAEKAGVDMTSPEPLRRAVGYFGHLVDELKASLQ